MRPVGRIATESGAQTPPHPHALQALATAVVGAHIECHFVGGDGANALIADGRAVRVDIRSLAGH